MSRMSGALAAVVVGLSLVTAAPATAEGAHHRYPTELPLPDGFRPEGIAIGDEPTAYLGSLADGDILRLDLRTGRSAVISQGPGTPSVGLKVDRRDRLFVAGGNAGNARVVDARNGAVLKSYEFGGPGAFVNDVALTDDAAYFTDSSKAVLYKIAFGRRGELPDTATTIPLTGDFVLVPDSFNSNGIAPTPDRKALLVVQSSTGKLFRVGDDGVAATVDLGGQALTAGDGLLVRGRTLYVVQNALNRVAVFALNRAGTSGKPVTTITDERFDVPTTVAAFGDRLYLPNARFGTPPTPTTPYRVIAVPNR
ncbi:SMP-30/gluconolactonase/LRE family protein [Saccharothrix australiensis]|uniref:Sugar lactone lactonase YvrE n=1 Tax=Saccharothrix australiensis TaxID=2072 RepID=A0A495W8G2_9PSEU|nr:superoxide dismutase [Saccharothrix australiensis]RKT56048.1 sugar lactone lactonase YvrE [Saccharothrix australiensis]